MSINWKEDYSVGVKEIDIQHHNFVSLMNKTYDAVYKNESKEKIVQILDELFSHAQNHFQTEERYFDKFNYPLKDEHKNVHNTLLGQIPSLKKSINESEDYAKEVLKLIDFLENWLVEHMLIHDKKYSEFFNQNGLF
jgi:hemerythrin